MHNPRVNSGPLTVVYLTTKEKEMFNYLLAVLFLILFGVGIVCCPALTIGILGIVGVVGLCVVVIRIDKPQFGEKE